MVYIKNILNISFVIIGTLVGAGFASGKEIYTFFCIYGIYGFFGLLISNIIIGFIIYYVFLRSLENNIESYSQYINFLVGNNKILNYTINNIINIFLLISFIIMVSGFGSFFSQEFTVSSIYGSILICIFTFITFFNNIDGIIKINSFLVPLLVLCIFTLGFNLDLSFLKINCLNKMYSNTWFLKSILYASYNSIILVPIIINLKSYITKETQIKIITFLCVSFLLIMSIIIYVLLYTNISKINILDIPMLYIINNFGFAFKNLYKFVILSAIFTTASSSGYSFLNNISKSKRQFFFFSIIICIISILLSNFGFTNLLNLLYPVLGYLGLIQIGLLLYKITP